MGKQTQLLLHSAFSKVSCLYTTEPLPGGKSSDKLLTRSPGDVQQCHLEKATRMVLYECDQGLLLHWQAWGKKHLDTLCCSLEEHRHHTYTPVHTHPCTHTHYSAGQYSERCNMGTVMLNSRQANGHVHKSKVNNSVMLI